MKRLLSVFAASTMILCLLATSPEAGWIENGVPLSASPGYAGTPKAIADGSRGEIIAYVSCYLGMSRIFVQRLNASGAAQWGEGGVVLCTAPGEGYEPFIASDGAGGAIVTWVDYRGGVPGLYAQRVNASGAIQWEAGAVGICVDPGFAIDPRIAADGAGGAFIVWEDYRTGDSDIYAQRISASGAVQWGANGIGICVYAGEQVDPEIAADGFGGAIITWKDQRSTNPNPPDIYAQRVDASGAVQWTMTGVPVCMAANYQDSPKIVSDGAGGAIIAWNDGRGNPDGSIYAQRLNASGQAQWALDGLAVLVPTTGGSAPQMISDGAGGAIVTWSDSRSGNADIFAQRIDDLGAAQWTANGVAICSAPGSQYDPQLVSDGAGGAIVVWSDYRDWSSDIYARRVTAAGSIQWTSDGVAICAGQLGARFTPQIVPDGTGGAIMTWYDVRGVLADIYAQRASSSGSLQWKTNGIALFMPGSQDFQQIVSDGAGGAIIAWEDYRNGEYDIYAQRVNASGVVLWASRGVAICTEGGDQTTPQMAPDGAGGAIIAWQDYRAGSSDVYAQRVNGSGVVQWTKGGVAVCTQSGDQQQIQMIPDGAGGAIIGWQDFRGADSDVYAQRVNASGVAQWTAGGVGVCTAAGAQYPPAIAPDGSGGAIMTWRDARTDQGDIYVQRVNAAGAAQWTTGGAALCTAAGEQGYPYIASDGAGGGIVTWQDERAGDRDIYARRVDASGAPQWTADGVAICTATGDQLGSQLVSDGAGGAIITWNDVRSGGDYDIYAQRIIASGAVQWSADGVALCARPANQEAPTIISDGAGGAVVAWQDYRDGSYDIYAQRVNALGGAQWAFDGVALSTAPGNQQIPVLTSDGASGAIVAWGDLRCGSSIVYAQRVRGTGQIVATLLRSYAAVHQGSGIRVEWVVSQIDAGARFSITRASAPDWAYEELEGTIVEQTALSFSFTDETCLPGSTYKYRVDFAAPGAERKTLFETQEIATPALPMTLYQNHPNPFNPRTVLRFYLPEARNVTLDVYDVSGRRVARLAEGMMEKGYHDVTWDGRNGSGKLCASGVYFSRLHAGKAAASRKMLLLR